MDAPPRGLTCNTPVELTTIVPAAAPRLSAATTTTHLGAVWITDAGQVGGVAVALPSADTVQLTSYREQLGALSEAPLTFASLAALPTSFLVTASFASASNIATFAQPFDDALTQPGSAVVLDVSLTDPHGAAASIDTSLFVVAGRGVTSTTALIVSPKGVEVRRANLTASPDRLVALGSPVAVLSSSTTAACAIQLINVGTGTLGSGASWGTAGQCTEPFAAHLPTRMDALLLRHDTIDNDINHTIAGLGGGGIQITGENRLGTPAEEGRAVAVSDGYWTTYYAAGMLIAEKVDPAGVIGTAHLLAPLATPQGHDLVVRGDDAYAVWSTGGGLWLARLCP